MPGSVVALQRWIKDQWLCWTGKLKGKHPLHLQVLSNALHLAIEIMKKKKLHDFENVGFKIVSHMTRNQKKKESSSCSEWEVLPHRVALAIHGGSSSLIILSPLRVWPTICGRPRGCKRGNPVITKQWGREMVARWEEMVLMNCGRMNTIPKDRIWGRNCGGIYTVGRIVHSSDILHGVINKRVLEVKGPHWII